MIYATLYVRDCSVLLQMRHSGVDASEHTQGFGIEPYFFTVNQWLSLLGTIPMLVVAAAPHLMLVNLSP